MSWNRTESKRKIEVRREHFMVKSTNRFQVSSVVGRRRLEKVDVAIVVQVLLSRVFFRE